MQGKFTLPVILLSIVAGTVFAAQWIREQNRVFTLTLATAGQQGEYYAFGEALAQVVANHYPKIRIEVLETAGSRENMQRLEQGDVQLALVQSDTPVEPSVQAVAFLFPEMFHLIAAQDADIQQVADLQGKRIALMPKGSGSYALFWPLVERYGLTENDFDAIPMLPADAHTALEQGTVDALFRIIALGNESVNGSLKASRGRLIPIDRAEALQLSLPYLEATQIPKGTYGGTRLIPPEDMSVIAVRAVMVARADVNQDVIYEITRSLHEFRNELVRQHPLSATIRLPDASENLGLPLHPGARAYYNQDDPNFLVEYAEPIGLLLSVSILGMSGIWQFRLWLVGRQKNRADMYNLEILELIAQVEDTEDLEQLAVVRRQLYKILQRVVVDLDVDRISPESFQSFTFPWEVAVTTIRHREMILTNVRSQRRSSAIRQDI
ncbi:MAG TPA: TAXI family TRAP transporter solute-binding subunit [Elainellaceae cyanobacterium]